MLYFGRFQIREVPFRDGAEDDIPESDSRVVEE